VLERKAGARAHLHLITGRNRDGEAGGDGMARAGSKDQILRRNDIHPRGARSRISGQGQALAVREAHQADRDRRAHDVRLGSAAARRRVASITCGSSSTGAVRSGMMRKSVAMPRRLSASA
jgi:hypothetical protein